MKQWAIGLMSNEEKRSILDKHRSLYDGYRTMQPQIAKEQPLYIQDFANDKNGITVNNKFDVKQYKNFGINESEDKKGMCSECGGMMQEGECMECGWKGDMEEQTQQVKDLENVEDLNPKNKFDYVEGDLEEDSAVDALAMQDVTGQQAPHDADNMAPDGMDDDSDNDRKMMADGEMEETQQGNPYDNEQSAYDFVSNGPLQEYDPMESSFEDDDNYGEELYPTFSDKKFVGMSKRSEDMDDNREEVDIFSDVDEDLKESVVKQKNRIMEMMNRMKSF